MRAPSPSPMAPLRRAAALLLAAVVALATLGGCGDDDASADVPPSSTTATAAAEGSDPDDAADTDADADADADADEAAGGPATRPSRGCGIEPDVAPIGPDRPGDVEQTFTTADGAVRTYRLGVPEDHDPDVAVPLVLNLHGAGSNGEQASIYGDVPRAATGRGMITVAPDAVDGRWELAKGADSAFLAALLDDVEGRYCIDLDRVHGLGMSLGAWKVAAVACGLGDRFASLALVTVEVFPGDCEPMPVVAFHGTDDNVAAYGEGGGTVAPEDATANRGIPGTRANIARWAESGGCDPRGAEEPIGDDVLWLRHDDCADGVSVELYTIVGGGHTWPGSDVVLGAPEHTTATIDATALALDFFEAHPR